MLATPAERWPITDEEVMGLALAAARDSIEAGEVPVGAVLVGDGEVIATAHNAPIHLHDPTAHAEILALRAAARRRGNYRLNGTTLYVTLEPCLMCVGALLHARVARVVYACGDPKSGALGSVFDVGRDGRGNHQVEVRAGVCAQQAQRLLQEFFQARRGS